MPQTDRYKISEMTKKGEDAPQARARLAKHVLLRLGASEQVATAGGAEASSDPRFLDDVVEGLVDEGSFALARLPDRRASEADLDPAVLGPAFAAALDRRRGMPAGARERARLARLYAIAGDLERAASCYREVFDEKGPPPLGIVLEIAEAAIHAQMRALALGAVDRIAEVVLTGDAGKEGRAEDVVAAGSALERARDVALELGSAPRAVALARAAVLIYERSGLAHEAARALDGLARAQAASGDRPGARSTFERRRALAMSQGEPAEAALSLEVAAAALIAAGDREAAAERLEQAADAHAAAGNRRAAARACMRVGELRALRGDLAPAGDALERARAHSAAAGDATLEASARLALAWACVAEGRIGSALKEAEVALNDRTAAKDEARTAEAHVILAQARLAVGDKEGARKELVLARDGAAGAVAARALELRAEIAREDGRLDDAHALLADAARSHASEGRPGEATRANVRRAEIALAAGDRTAAIERWKIVAETEEPELVARAALLEAALAADEATRRSALDRAFDLAFATDHHGPRVAAGLARAEARLAAGKAAQAGGDARAALDAIRDVRKGLPDELRQGYLAASPRRDAHETGKKVRDALAELKEEVERATDDETSGIESNLNALDVLLGVLAPST